MTPITDSTYGDTRIIVATIADTEAEFEHILSASTRDESKKKFRSTTRQQEWLAARVLLHYAFRGEPHSPTIAYLPTGRPYLPDCPFGISLSHSHDFIGLALSRTLRVGLDLEIRAPRAMRLKHSFLSEREKQIFKSDNADIFTTLWSAKEAAYKWLDRPGTYLSQFSFEAFPLTDSGELRGNWQSLPLHVRYRIFEHFVLTWTDWPLPHAEVAPRQ